MPFSPHLCLKLKQGLLDLQEWRTRAANSTAALFIGADMLRQTAPFYSESCGTWMESLQLQDPTPRESEFNFDELREACIKACRRSFSLMAAKKSLLRPSEEQVRQREEQDRKFLMVALEVYTKQNNMQPTELEFVEVKRRNLIDESGLGYLHFNFLVKGLDGKYTMFFAEVHHDLEDEKDVLLCKPLGEDDLKLSKKNDQALCKACEYEAKDLMHPSCGSFRGGHKNISTVIRDNFNDDSDYEFD